MTHERRNRAHFASHLTILPAALALALLATLGGCSQPVVKNQAPRQVREWPGFAGKITHTDDIYIAGQPSAEALRGAPEHKIGTVVNLRTQEEMAARVNFDEPALVQELGMTYVSIPITVDSFSAADADRLAEVIEEAEASKDKKKRGVLVHCASAGRAGALRALYQVRHKGLSPEEATTYGQRAGMASSKTVRMFQKALEAGN